jgi:hypothetical protein
LILINHLGFIEQPANQRRFAIINAAAGNEAQQLLPLMLRKVLVNIRGDEC